MTAILYLIACVAILAGFGFFANAKSAIHEIEGLLSLILGFLLIGLATVATKLDRLTAVQRALADRLPAADAEHRPVGRVAPDAVRS